MCALRGLLQRASSPKIKRRANKKALESQGHFCHVGRLPQVAQVIFVNHSYLRYRLEVGASWVLC